MMRKILLSLILFLLLVGIVSAQDEQTPEELALSLIAWAQESDWTELNLSGLGLTELPPELWELTDLRKLYLGYRPGTVYGYANQPNRLRELSPDIARLYQLEELDLSDNLLTSLPPEIGSLQALEVLTLANNQLSSLPPEMGQLKSLCILNLVNNNLRELPNQIGGLSYLEDELLCRGSYRTGIALTDNPQLLIPDEVIAQGTPAILAYLRNEALWHLQRLILGAASSIALLAAIVLGFRWKNRRGKTKAKRG